MLPAVIPQLHAPRQHVLLTGATGFVGQAVLEQLLSGTDAVVWLVVRSSADMCAVERVRQLMSKDVFAPWRERVGTDVVERTFERRINIIDADLSALVEVPKGLDLVIHSASSVKFDEEIDSAFSTNVGGPQALYRALLASGSSPHVIHVSTAYVQTDRVQVAYEGRVDHEVCWRSELVDAIAARTGLVREAAARGTNPREVKRRLIDLGRQRAQDLGWTDVYTFTKAMGERVAEELWGGNGHRLTIVRPTIIESALQHPYPGWIDGFKVADPIIAAYAKGRLVGFPGDPSTVLDLIPVDLVVGTILAAAAQGAEYGQSSYLQIGSGTSNPMTLGDLREHVQDYFAVNPWIGSDGEAVVLRRWNFSPPATFRRDLGRRRQALTVADTLLRRVTATRSSKVRQRTLLNLRKLDALQLFVDLYQPYCTSATIFDDANTRELSVRTAHHGSRGYDLDVSSIDWARYLREVHLPALVAMMRASGRGSRTTTAGSRPLRPTAAVTAVAAAPIASRAALAALRAHRLTSNVDVTGPTTLDHLTAKSA